MKTRVVTAAVGLCLLAVVLAFFDTVLFDLVLPAGYTGDRAEVLRQLREFVTQQDEHYICVIKVEQSYASAHREK